VNYSYHPDARREASASIAYYGAIDEQLAADFISQLENSIARILSAPEAWTKQVAGTRLLAAPFPLGRDSSCSSREYSDYRSDASQSKARLLDRSPD
jgi:hypothetical protein